MTWIIITLILLAAFGPVLWLVPSKRDRQLSAVRDQARREGLVVELRKVPKLNPSADERVSAGGRVKEPVVDCTAYIHTLGRRLSYLPSWRLLRGQDAHNSRGEDHRQPRPGWAFDPEFKPDLAAGRVAFDASLAGLEHLFQGMPADVVAVELGVRSLTVYWLESRGAERATVTALSELMSAADDRLRAADDQFQPLPDDDDS
ncbi:MAG: hypothetical protein OEU92_24160 [Alphaproteobacteria bacterium]|nr:hypothetical protein [Alphaproteobacteria bacterium]